MEFQSCVCIESIESIESFESSHRNVSAFEVGTKVWDLSYWRVSIVRPTTFGAIFHFRFFVQLRKFFSVVERFLIVEALLIKILS